MADHVLEESPVRKEPAAIDRDRLLFYGLLAATAAGLVVCLLIAAPFVPALTWALALAVIAHPVHDRIAARVHNADIAAGISVVLVAVLLVAPLVLIGSQIVDQAATGVQFVQEQMESGEWRAKAQQTPYIGPAIAWIEQQVNLRDAVASAAGAVRERAGRVLQGTAWTIMQLFISLFALFFFFRDRRQVLGGLRSMVPLSNREVNEVFDRIRSMVRASVFGTVMVSLAQGTLGGLMFWFLGLPAPALWALVMSVFALIPTLGAPVVWVPPAAVLAAQGSWGKAAILAAWGTLAVGLIDNLLYPVLVGKEMRLHTLVVFVAVVGGLFLFGASGIVLGPVALAITLALIDVIRRRTAFGRSADEPT